MTTQYVFASHADEALRFFQSGHAVGTTIGRAAAIRNFGRTKLFKAVTKEVPGKSEWLAWFKPIPEGATVCWVECDVEWEVPSHGDIVNLRYKHVGEHWCDTPGLWRYPVIETLTASTTTTKITELK